MEDEQKSNDSQRRTRCEASRPSTETVCVVEASLPGDTPSVGETEEHVSATMKGSQHGELEIGQYSGSDALNSEGIPAVAEFEHGESSHAEFSAGTSQAALDLQTVTDIIAGVEHVPVESVLPLELLNNFREAIQDYNKVYDCYACLHSVMGHDIAVLGKLKGMMDEAERKNDEGPLSILVAETKEKFAKMRIRISQIRDVYTMVHYELNDLWSQIDYDFREQRSVLGC